MSDVTQSLGMQRRIARDREVGRLMAASRDARNEGDTFTANTYYREAHRQNRINHPLKGDRKSGGY